MNEMALKYVLIIALFALLLLAFMWLVVTFGGMGAM